MPRSPVPFAAETLETVQRAFREARARRHDAVGLEHLLVALTHETTARQILTACGANLDALRAQATEVLERGYPAVPGSAKVEPEPTIGFDRVIQHAVMHAAASSATEVSSGDLLVFMLQEDESHAAFFLKSNGVERLSLLRVISHGAA
ncbi:MAG TPA: Clp protease N-terminal domain-containing protein, partial [Vicinamibacterales bacterium]